LSEEVRECVRHAEEYAARAKIEPHPAIQRDFIDMELRWLQLARSYQFLEQFRTCSAEHAKQRGELSSRLEHLRRRFQSCWWANRFYHRGLSTLWFPIAAHEHLPSATTNPPFGAKVASQNRSEILAPFAGIGQVFFVLTHASPAPRMYFYDRKPADIRRDDANKAQS
jgi:hypothetical protein